MSEMPAVVRPMLSTLSKILFSNPDCYSSPSETATASSVSCRMVLYDSPQRIVRPSPKIPRPPAIAKSLEVSSAVLDGETAHLSMPVVRNKLTVSPGNPLSPSRSCPPAYNYKLSVQVSDFEDVGLLVQL